MSKKFDADEYVSRWDDKLIPIILVVIVSAMIGVYALNVLARPACTTHEYVFCGTPLNTYEQHEEADGSHNAEAAPHAGEAEGEGHPH